LDDRLGLFGGTFNPIHHGHLVALQETMLELSLDRVLLIPTHNPPHKESPEVDASHRARMTELAVQDDDFLTVSRVELEREGPSYTIHTLQALRDNHPEESFVLLIGGDELVQFTEWKDWDAILQECDLVGMNRPGTDEVQSADPDVMDNVRYVDIPEIEISSTMIRKRLRNDRPAEYFLPESVRDYIDKHDLYRS
jgi:nicotinate-nucleotide adenylyltransferase